MKRIICILLTLTALISVFASCESTAPSDSAALSDSTETLSANTDGKTTQTETESPMKKLIANAAIPLNEQKFEHPESPWSLRYLTPPDDAYSGVALSFAYYDKTENVLKYKYTAVDGEGKLSADSMHLAVYDLKGNLLRTEAYPYPDDENMHRRTTNVTDYGYIMVYRYTKDNLKTDEAITTEMGIIKYYKDTDTFETVFDHLNELAGGEVSYYLVAESDDGTYYLLGYREFREKRPLGWLLHRSDMLYGLSPEGEKIFAYELDIEDGMAFSDIFTHNGQVYLTTRNKSYLIPDPETQSFKAPEFPKKPEQFSYPYGNPSRPEPTPSTVHGQVPNYRMFGGGYDIYYHENDGIYGQNYIGLEKPEDPVKILDYASSSFSPDSVTIGRIINETCITAEAKSIFSGTTIEHMSKTSSTRKPALLYYDAEKVEEGKKTITLAHTRALYEDVRTAITYFNMNSTEYRIITQDYSAYEDPAAQLEKEFGMGKYPDILYITQDIDYTNLTVRGFMTDLYTLGIDKNDLVPVVRTKSEFGGGLYRLPMTFAYSALISKNDYGTIDIDKLIELYGVHGNALFPQLRRGTLLDNMIQAGILNGFIDLHNAKCDFNNPKFISLLEFLRSYENNPEDNMAFKFSPEANVYQQQLVKGGMGEYLTVSTYQQHCGLPAFHYLYDKADYVINGFPTTDGDGFVIEPNYEFGITKASANKEGAMEFLKLMFESKESETYMWPFMMRTNYTVMLNRIDEFYNSGIHLTYYDTEGRYVMNFTGNGMEGQFDRFTDNPEIYEIFEVSKEEIDRFIDTVLNADTSAPTDEMIVEIINDELTPYLAGQDTASNVAHRINSRVGIYLAERYS